MLPENKNPAVRYFLLNSFIFGRIGDSTLHNRVDEALWLNTLNSYEDIKNKIEIRGDNAVLSADDTDREYRLNLLNEIHELLITQRNALETALTEKNDSKNHNAPDPLIEERRKHYRIECDRLEESVVLSYIRKMMPPDSLYSFKLSKVMKRQDSILKTKEDCRKVGSQIEHYVRKISGLFVRNEFDPALLANILILAIEFDKEKRTPSRVRLIVSTLYPDVIFREPIKSSVAEEFHAMDAFLINLRNGGTRPNFEENYADIHKFEAPQKAYYEFVRNIVAWMQNASPIQRVLHICAGYLDKLETQHNEKELDDVLKAISAEIPRMFASEGQDESGLARTTVASICRIIARDVKAYDVTVPAYTFVVEQKHQSAHNAGG